MQLGNPMTRRLSKRFSGFETEENAGTATYAGVYTKSAVFAAITIVTALLTEFLTVWFLGYEALDRIFIALLIATLVSFIPLIVMALIISFVPTTAKVLGFIYVIIEGGVLGLLALCVDYILPGAAFAALAGTGLVLLASLIVNYVFKKRISSAFVRGLIVITVSLVVIQLAVWVISLFVPMLSGTYFWIQFGISVLCIIWATVMLFCDLSNIDSLVQTGAEKKYEWYAAFSLVTTLIYMYIEILELILRIAALFRRD